MALAATSDTKTSGNGVYDGSFITAAAATAAVLAGYAVLAAWRSGVSLRESYALVRPVAGWWRIAGVAFVAILVFNLALDPILNGDEAQGISPDRSPHGGEWVTLGAALVVLGVLVPMAEELMFRGLAFAALGRYAVPGSAALFAVAHGLPQLLPFVFVAGLALAEVRRRTESLYPGMLVHGLLNTVGIIAALLTA